MSKGLENDKDRVWVAGVVLVGLAALSFVLGLALPLTQPKGGLTAHDAGSVEHHATAATPLRSAR